MLSLSIVKTLKVTKKTKNLTTFNTNTTYSIEYIFESNFQKPLADFRAGPVEKCKLDSSTSLDPKVDFISLNIMNIFLYC